MKYILGIESSFDNSCLTIIYKKNILLSFNINQDFILKNFGYIPNLLSDNQLLAFKNIIDQLDFSLLNKIDYIAVTNGPGKIFSLVIGHYLAKTISILIKKPIFYVDHIEAHILSPRFISDISFPFFSLVISGGHCLFFLVKEIGNYELISYSIDDAPGEIIDKIARKLNLTIPNGVYLEKEAINGQLINKLNSLNIRIKSNQNLFSFSGIKTRFIQYIEKTNNINSDTFVKNVAYTAQETIFKYIIKKILKLIKNYPMVKTICFTGGVASNLSLRQIALSELKNLKCQFTPINISIDNAEMIAWCCYEYLNKEQYKKNLRSNLCYSNSPYDIFIYKIK